MLTSIRGPIAAILLAGTALAATPAWADEPAPPLEGSDETDPPGEFELTGNVALVTDYRWRGLSYSGGDFALQGQLNLTHQSGFYAGVWASSLEQDPLDIYGSAEVDVYAGWSGDIASGLTADAGVTWYVYPNGSFGKANYFEPYASLSTTLGPASAKLGMSYAWKQDSLGGDDNLYLYTDLGVGIPNTPISLSAHLGYTDGALSPKLLTLASTDGGWDYSLGATWNITSNLSLGASYVGVDGNAFDGLSNDTVVGTLKFAF